MKNILVVESDTDLNNLIQLHLENSDCHIDQSYTSEDGLNRALSNPYDLILVDMKDHKGLEIYQTLRTENIHQPIVMLTACREERQTLAALAQDQCYHLTKPFRISELINIVKRTGIN